MKQNSNKRSGKYFESKVAQKLRKTFGLTKLQCRRAAHSGSASYEFGDIFFYDYTKYDIVLECKFLRHVSVSMLYPKLSSKLCKFLNQCYIEVKRFKKHMNFVPSIHGVVLGIKNGPVFLITQLVFKTDHVVITNSEQFGNVYIYDFDEVLEVIKNGYQFEREQAKRTEKRIHK